MKNQYEKKILSTCLFAQKVFSNSFFYNKSNDPITLKNTAEVEFIDKSLNKVRFAEVNNSLAVGEHSTTKHFVSQAISNSVGGRSSARNSETNELDNHFVISMSHIT